MPAFSSGRRGTAVAVDEVLLQYIDKINLISLCSHAYPRPNSTREVRRSLTWHSSKSESARGRFEPVAAAMLWRDDRRILFALVAARRRKELKEGLTHMRSMCVGVAETGVNTFLFLSFSFFSDKRKEHYKKSYFKYLSGHRRHHPIQNHKEPLSSVCKKITVLC